MKHLHLLIALFFSTSLATNAQEVLSPNKNIKVILTSKKTTDKASFGQVYFKVQYKMDAKCVEALPNSPLGILRTDNKFTNSLKFVGMSKLVEIHDKYEMICGKRKLCENFGSERVFHYINSSNQPLDIVFRAYNNGVTFRYIFPNHSDSLVNIIDEATAYVLPDSTSRWMQPYETSYEDFYPLNRTGLSSKNTQEWSFPALYKVNGNPLWVLMSEASITEHNCAAKLCNMGNNNEYKVKYPSARNDFKQIGVMASLPWKSQWHTLAIGKLSDIVESTLTTDVCEPNKLKDTDWIKAGNASWIYWANNHGSKDYKKVVEYIDFAAEMNWPYVLIDWEWDVMSNGGTIVDAVNYAKSKGVKPLMWYNSGTSWFEPTPVDRLLTAQKRAEEFSWLNKIGVFGIKVDFFAGDQQDMMKYYIDILKDAANYHLMVNFHGATVPRGWARTYPNLMTTEAVYGAEWYNNHSVLTNKAAGHSATLPFTRNVVGSMDYTPVTFSNSQHPHITSYSHELALSVVFESGLQHFADSPSSYNSLPTVPKEFLKKVPTNWDDTKLIDGYPGSKVIIARRKGAQWYLGGLNGTDEVQTLKINFKFLRKGNFSLKLIEDGKDEKSFTTKTLIVKREDVITVECIPRGGFVGVLEKSNN